MTTNTNTTTNTEIDVKYETSKFALGVGVAAAALIGIWSVGCIANVVLQNGIGGTLRGLLGAIIGS